MRFPIGTQAVLLTRSGKPTNPQSRRMKRCGETTPKPQLGLTTCLITVPDEGGGVVEMLRLACAGRESKSTPSRKNPEIFTNFGIARGKVPKSATHVNPEQAAPHVSPRARRRMPGLPGVPENGIQTNGIGDPVLHQPRSGTILAQ